MKITIYNITIGLFDKGSVRRNIEKNFFLREEAEAEIERYIWMMDDRYNLFFKERKICFTLSRDKDGTIIGGMLLNETISGLTFGLYDIEIENEIHENSWFHILENGFPPKNGFYLVSQKGNPEAFEAFFVHREKTFYYLKDIPLNNIYAWTPLIKAAKEKNKERKKGEKK